MQINTCGRHLAFFNGAMDASVVVCAEPRQKHRVGIMLGRANSRAALAFSACLCVIGECSKIEEFRLYI